MSTERTTEPDDATLDQDPLIIYTVYKHPRDYPEEYVVRRFYCREGGVDHDAEPCLITRTLAEIEDELAEFGLAKFLPDPEDDPCIIATWI